MALVPQSSTNERHGGKTAFTENSKAVRVGCGSKEGRDHEVTEAGPVRQQNLRGCGCRIRNFLTTWSLRDVV